MNTKTVPFLDLSREIQPLKNQIQEKINDIFFNKTNFILGNELNVFENNFAKYIGTNYCIGVANGTDAVEIAVQSLNLKSDDEILTQSNTYVATCFGVTNNNMKLKLVDINKQTYQMDLDELEKNITDKTKVIIIVHLTGSCCNMNKLMEIVIKYNLILIEDCAQSHGASYNNKKLGTFGILSTFSFYPGKNLGAFGDGGAICTNDENLHHKIKQIRNNGSIEKYIHNIFGRNSRLDTIQAAILDIKLQHLDMNNEKRRNNALIYINLLQNNENIQLPVIENNCIPVYHLFIIRVKKRDELQHHLRQNNIGTGIHYPIPIIKLKCYENYFDNLCINSSDNCNTILSLPMFPDITIDEITFVCNKIVEFYNE